MIYDNVGGIRDSFKQNLDLEFHRINKKTSLTETRINHDQIHHQVHISNNWLGTNFFSPGHSHTKGLLVILHPGLQCITEVDTDPKRAFFSFTVTPLPLFMPLQGIAPGSSWLWGVCLKDYKIKWTIKMMEMNTK